MHAAAQYERSFVPRRLGNWEIPDTSKLESTSLSNRFDQTAPRTSATKFIAGDNGYLNPLHKKAGVTAFTTTDRVQRPVYAESKPRWPEVRALGHSDLLSVAADSGMQEDSEALSLATPMSHTFTYEPCLGARRSGDAALVCRRTSAGPLRGAQPWATRAFRANICQAARCRCRHTKALVQKTSTSITDSRREPHVLSRAHSLIAAEATFRSTWITWRAHA